MTATIHNLYIASQHSFTFSRANQRHFFTFQQETGQDLSLPTLWHSQLPGGEAFPLTGWSGSPVTVKKVHSIWHIQRTWIYNCALWQKVLLAARALISFQM